jgi:ABC-2 type transport system permease protein
MFVLLVMTSMTFSLFGFIIGIWADGFEKLQVIPLLVITPLTFLGGSFYSIKMLPPFWQSMSMMNPVVYLINAFRWSFFETTDVSLGLSLAMIGLFFVVCLTVASMMFKTGYRIKH